jgi:ribosomal protein L11 methyltransferase
MGSVARYRRLAAVSSAVVIGSCASLTLLAASDYDGGMSKRRMSQQSNIPLGRGGQWLELSITLPASCADDVGAVLVSLGSPGVVEESAAGGARMQQVENVAMAKLLAAFPLEQVGERLLHDIRDCLDGLALQGGSQATVAMQLTRGDAWVNQWQQFYRPFKLGARLVIRPPWESYMAAPGELVLTLNPGQAFGTGLHPTTRLCLDALEARVAAQPRMRILDVGCGSGILSLAAILFGYMQGYGVDLDPIAVRVARVNARLNRLSKQAAFAVGSLEIVSGQFEVVVANILLEPIMALLPSFHAALAPGGTMILSGILAAELSQLQGSLSANRWRIIQQVTHEEWAAIICEEV